MISKRKSSNSRRMFFAATGLAVMFSLVRIFWPLQTSALAISVAKPIWNFRNSLFNITDGSGEYLESKQSLIADKKNLSGEISLLRIQNAELQSKINAISSSTEARLFGNETAVLAKVINKPPFSPYDTLTIDRGSENGIAIGEKAYLDSNILIGFITNVSDTSSNIDLYSKGGHTEPAEVMRTKESVVLTGNGGGNYEMNLPKDFDIQVGDQIITLDARGSILGTVFYVDTSSQSSFKKVLARIPYNIFQTDWVNIEASQ